MSYINITQVLTEFIIAPEETVTVFLQDHPIDWNKFPKDEKTIDKYVFAKMQNWDTDESLKDDLTEVFLDFVNLLIASDSTAPERALVWIMPKRWRYSDRALQKALVSNPAATEQVLLVMCDSLSHAQAIPEVFHVIISKATNKIFERLLNGAKQFEYEEWALATAEDAPDWFLDRLFDISVEEHSYYSSTISDIAAHPHSSDKLLEKIINHLFNYLDYVGLQNADEEAFYTIDALSENPNTPENFFENLKRYQH